MAFAELPRTALLRLQHRSIRPAAMPIKRGAILIAAAAALGACSPVEDPTLFPPYSESTAKPIPEKPVRELAHLPFRYVPLDKGGSE